MRIQESELIINGDGSVFHLHLKPEELADNVILVGDPGRVDLVAKYLTEIEFRHESREFVSTTGKYNDKRVTVLSTGIGTDNIDIVMNELDALANVDFITREIKEVKKSLNILRIGTSGAIQPDIPVGSFVFSEISVGCDGLMNWYADRDSISDLDMEKAFVESVNWNRRLPSPYFVRASEDICNRFKNDAIMGVTISASGFYGPQGRVLRIPLSMPNMLDDFQAFQYNGYKITNFEMESSAIAGIAHHLGHKAGTICVIIANRHLKNSNANYKDSVDELIRMALENFLR
jgi:uridine phosphorylase